MVRGTDGAGARDDISFLFFIVYAWDAGECTIVQRSSLGRRAGS